MSCFEFLYHCYRSRCKLHFITWLQNQLPLSKVITTNNKDSLKSSNVSSIPAAALYTSFLSQIPSTTSNSHHPYLLPLDIPVPGYIYYIPQNYLLPYLLHNHPMDIDFLKVHFLAARFERPEAFSQSELTDIASKALHIMDIYQSLHPAYPLLQAQLKAACHPDAERFLSEWVRKVELNAPKTSYLVEMDDGLNSDKHKIVDEFKQVFAVLLIQCDFRMIQFYLAKLENIASFPLLVTNHEAFAENRYFEYLFYQLLAMIFGTRWFVESKSPRKETEESLDGPAEPRTIQSIDKKNGNYYTRHAFLFKSLDEKPEAVVKSLQPELDYYKLNKWLITLIKFTQGSFGAFVEEFERLQEHIQVLDSLGLVSEALCMYALASIATKPFNQLNMNLNEALVDAFTSDNGGLENEVYEVLRILASGEFHAAKQAILDPSLLDKLYAHIGFALPEDKDTFFERLCRLIDQKAFLLILSITKRILRQKILTMLGYSSENIAIYNDVSNKLLLLISALNLGESKIVYEDATDLFLHKPLSDAERQDMLQNGVSQLVGDVRAEASATMLKSVLIRKHYD